MIHGGEKKKKKKEKKKKKKKQKKKKKKKENKGPQTERKNIAKKNEKKTEIAGGGGDMGQSFYRGGGDQCQGGKTAGRTIKTGNRDVPLKGVSLRGGPSSEKLAGSTSLFRSGSRFCYPKNQCWFK